MRTVIDAIIDIVERNAYSLNSSLLLQGNNIVQANGVPFEDYVMNLFSDNLFETNKNRFRTKIDEVYSCLHAKNYSPDFIINGGDAIEVKKTEKYANEYQFNSSYPKKLLFPDSPKLVPGALKHEQWEQKDMLYVFGVVPQGKRISLMSFIYGTEFAADRRHYEDLEDKIRDSVSMYDSSETNELGRLNGIDPLRMTSLRITRGMWLIKNPLRLIEEYWAPNPDHSFDFVCLMDCNKYDSDPRKDYLLKLSKTYKNLQIREINISDPDTLISKKSMLITYFIK